MTFHYSCEWCRGTLGPQGCPVHSNNAGSAARAPMSVPLPMPGADRPTTIVDELGLVLEPIRDLLRYLTDNPKDVPSYETYKQVWNAGRQALTTLERLAGVASVPVGGVDA